MKDASESGERLPGGTLHDTTAPAGKAAGKPAGKPAGKRAGKPAAIPPSGQPSSAGATPDKAPSADAPPDPQPAAPSERRPSVPTFSDFARAAFPTLEARAFHEAYYRLLEAFAAGRVRRMIVTMPPQHGKSHGASVLLPAYMLGLDPDRRVAIASYSALLASRFNRRVQRLIESREYAAMFPDTTIKRSGASKSSGESGGYIRTSDHVEIIGREGELFSVGREGSLTGNRVDTFIIDDLYKDAMEANSPVVRENCWEWYTSVVRTRMHNDSSELIVNTRWHEEDLTGMISTREEVRRPERWSELDAWPPEVWLHLNLEALKTSPPSEIDPRTEGDALWEERHSGRLLLRKRALDPVGFDCLYQGAPSTAEGLLYAGGLKTYDALPAGTLRRENYTDTADMGDDFLCSVCYAAGSDGFLYVTDVVYSSASMEVTEGLVAEMLARNDTRLARIESNNGGRGFARAVEKLAAEMKSVSGEKLTAGVKVEWFHQAENKEARILSNSSTVTHLVRLPADWARRWPDFHHCLVTYRRLFRANRWHDAADVLTGIVERGTEPRQGRIHALGYRRR